MAAALNLIADPAPGYVPAREFADAMSALASGVVLVTCRVGDRPWGTTVTAFSSVSAEPPTILVSLGSTSTSARAIAASRRFGVSILAADQSPAARRGSIPGADKFLDAWSSNDASLAVGGALAHLDCRLIDAVPVADHTVFFGRVLEAWGPVDGRPLVYHRRGYTTVAPAVERGATWVSS